jgi:hypothetical protein
VDEKSFGPFLLLHTGREKPIEAAPNKLGEAANLLTRIHKVVLRISIRISTILTDSFRGFVFEADARMINWLRPQFLPHPSEFIIN